MFSYLQILKKSSVILVVLSTHIYARDPGLTPRALGLGDAVHAIGMGTSGLYFNPACMSQVTSYAIDVGYGYQGIGAIHDVHVSAVDSHLTNPELAGGVGYSHFRSEKTGAKVRGHDIRTALSSKVGKDRVIFAFGAGFRYLKVYSEEETLSAPTLDVGVLLMVLNQFYVGVSGQNLITMDRRWAPRRLGGGIGFRYNTIHLSSDIEVDFDSKEKVTVSPAAGIEFIALSSVALRAGYRWDRVYDNHLVSSGVGYISKYVGVDVGYAQDPKKKEDWIISGSVRVFLP